jgi:4-hydroxy-tetrahydrodipicolinate synthase
MPDIRGWPTGFYTDLVTPFKGGALDIEGFKRLLEMQCEQGVSGVVVCGLAGEATSLALSERADLISTAVCRVGRELSVIAGVGTHCTRSSIAQAQQAAALGAHALLVVLPYYSKPTMQGVACHLTAIRDAVNLPILVADAPARTGIRASDSLLSELATMRGIVGLVDYGADLDRLAEHQRTEPSLLPKLCGNDIAALPFAASGGVGAVSLAGNIAPRLFVSRHHALCAPNPLAAVRLNQNVLPLLMALEREHPIAAVKFALSRTLGLGPELRLPLVPLEPASAREILDALAHLEVTHPRRNVA